MSVSFPLPENRREDEFEATLGQTVFALTFEPIAGSEMVHVNGLKLDRGVDYSLVGSTLTYIPGASGYTMVVGDKVEINYRSRA